MWKGTPTPRRQQEETTVKRGNGRQNQVHVLSFFRSFVFCLTIFLLPLSLGTVIKEAQRREDLSDARTEHQQSRPHGMVG